MRPVRDRLGSLLAAAAIACVAAGCMGGSGDRGSSTGAADNGEAAAGAEQDDRSAERAGATKREDAASAEPSVAEEPVGPGDLARALPADCRRGLQALDTAHARAVAQAERSLRRRDATSRTLRRLKRSLTAADRAVRAERRTYDAARRPLEAFLDRHPEHFLDSTAFDDYERLRQSHDAARAPYERAVDAYDALVVQHNRQVARFNALTAQANRLGKAAGVRHDRFQQRAGACLERVTNWKEHVAGLEHRLGETAMAGVDGPFATVSCDSPEAWAEDGSDDPSSETYERHGFVRVGESEIHLGPRACFVLDSVLGEAHPRLACVSREVQRDFPLCVPSRAEAAVALTTLAHEAQHVAGARDEAKAECAAIQTVDAVAAALGLPATTSSRLGRFTLRRVTLPPAYRSAECRRGGKLDLEPQTKAWP